MKRFRQLAPVFGAAGALLATIPAAPGAQRVELFQQTVTRTLGYTALISIPAGYEDRNAEAWPTLVFLHGSGERGSDPVQVTRHGPPMLVRGTSPAAEESEEARTRRKRATALLKQNFIVVSPQCPDGRRWEDDSIVALIDEVVAKYRVDERRLYLTGLSLGGFGTWSLGIKQPGRFAAIALVCGGGQLLDVLLAAKEKSAALQSLGVWAFHGALDAGVPLEESERMIAALRKVGVADLKLTVSPKARHNSWTETYSNPDLYEWLLAHRR